VGEVRRVIAGKFIPSTYWLRHIMTTNQQLSVRPAVVNVGDEVIYGERNNENQRWMLDLLYKKGIPASVALSLPDDIDVISHWIKQLHQSQHFPVVVSGGIGGTHDDCTRQAIAQALSVPLTRNPEVFNLLAVKYGEGFHEERQRMADLPEGCELIKNPFGAPGFMINGVYAFPGFPNMMKPMMQNVIEEILANGVITTILPEMNVKDVVLPISEGDIALELEAFLRKYGNLQVKIGIYPNASKSFSQNKEVLIRLRYPNTTVIEVQEMLVEFDATMKKYLH